MAFPKKSGLRHCLVEGCSVQSTMQSAMQVRFWHWHVRETMVILEEVNPPHPRCPLCIIIVP